MVRVSHPSCQASSFRITFLKSLDFTLLDISVFTYIYLMNFVKGQRLKLSSLTHKAGEKLEMEKFISIS